MPRSKVFYIAIAAGVVFIAIGIASSVYSNVPVDVPLDNVIRPGTVDIITPDMNVENTASISVSGTTHRIEIRDPDGKVIESRSDNSTFSYDLTAQKAGQYRITINNTGTADLTIAGHVQTKSSPLGLSGALMLVVTGIITVGLGLRFRSH
ncbi:MAG TPA: hypothetical protein VJ695_09355 [Nitrososphaera sp.]|nr:hypothetical protein [Nitrososphaera sp.]